MTDDRTVSSCETSVVEDISFLIKSHLRATACEQCDPSCHADLMDAKILTGITTVGKLRKMREDFENITTGFIS